MRVIINKKTSTKAERKFIELLKKQHIKYLYKKKIDGREIDFIIGKYAIEIDGHDQDPIKNHMLVKNGYIPIHFNNKEIKESKLWLDQIFS